MQIVGSIQWHTACHSFPDLQIIDLLDQQSNIFSLQWYKEETAPIWEAEV